MYNKFLSLALSPSPLCPMFQNWLGEVAQQFSFVIYLIFMPCCSSRGQNSN